MYRYNENPDAAGRMLDLCTSPTRNAQVLCAMAPKAAGAVVAAMEVRTAAAVGLYSC